MQIFSIPKNACLISNFDMSAKIGPNSHCNITNFKLAFPTYYKIYFVVSAVFVLLLCFVKEGNLLCINYPNECKIFRAVFLKYASLTSGHTKCFC